MKQNTQATVETESRGPEQEIQHILHRMELVFQLFIGTCLGMAALILLSLLWP